VSHRILRARVPEISADAPIGGGIVRDRPALNRQPADQHKTAAVEHFFAQAIEHRAKFWERKIGPREVSEITPAQVRHRRLDLVDFGR